MSRVVEFDIDLVVKKAMSVFWEKGYERTSMNDLITATGLLKGSIYNTFGSKEKLFLRCLDCYGVRSKSLFFNDGDDPKLYLRNFFNRLVNEGKSKSFSRGCFIMNSCLEFANSKNEKANMSKVLFGALELNLRRVVIAIIGDHNLKEAEVIGTGLVTAAFSIREISKFRKDNIFLKQIANNALDRLDIKI